MIRRHMQRGDIYPHVQLKCWKHIRTAASLCPDNYIPHDTLTGFSDSLVRILVVLELQDLPCFATRYAADSARAANASPSRGKIRPGKELIILSDDDANQESRANDGDNEPPLSEESDLGPPNDPTETTAAALTASATAKKFSSLSMAERQAEWLRKKQEKMEAERSRQEEEKDKELTFQPKILRRLTLGEKPTKDATNPSAPQPPRVIQRSDTGGNSRKLDISGASEPSKPSAGPKEKAIPRVPPRSAGRRKKPQSSVSVSQPIEISSDLLDSMKSELMASISKRSSLSPTKAAAMTENGSDESSAIEAYEATTESPEATVESSTEDQLPLKSWSDQPMLGGRRIDFDSSETKARLVLQDAAKFELSTMYRKTDKKARRDGVALHMGRREDNFEEEVIAVLFDKDKVSELEAARWWCEHEHRFTEFMRELPKPMDFGFA